MRKIYIYFTVILALFILVYFAANFIKIPTSKYEVLTINSESNLVKAIASYITLPIIEARIDFYLKNTGIITYLEENKYDNKILNIEDVKEGEGKEVLCGEEVLVDLIEISEGGITKNIDNQKIKIGINELQALNIALIGMKKGGERNIIIPKDASNRLIGKDNTTVMYTIKLKEIKSYHINDTKNLLIFDEIKGNEKAVMCGESVSLKYVAKNRKGEEIKQGNLTFQVGSGKVPLAFELGVIEMVPGSKRSVITPPSLIQDKNFPKDEVTILDLSIS